MRIRPVSLACLALLGACGGERDKAPRAALAVDVIGQMRDGPALDGPRAILTQSTQAGLVALDANGNVVPSLATSWRVSDDGLSLIFRLRDAKWPDGRTVTAGDVVAVYRRLLGPGSRHPLAGLLDGIVNARQIASGSAAARTLGVTDPLPNIVEIRLTAPQPELLQLLASPSMAIVRRGGDAPSNGAFSIGESKDGAMTLVRSESYFDAGAVPLGRVTLTATLDPLEAIERFRSGKAQVVMGGALEGLAEASRLGRAFEVDPARTTYGYTANLRSGPLKDPRVRRALAMAVEREALAEGLPGVAASTSLVPPGLPGDSEPARPDWSDWLPEARLAEAARLLGEAGYGPDKPLSIEVLLPRGAAHREVLTRVAADWARLGVQTVAIEKEGGTFDAALARGRYQLALAERRAFADAPLFYLDPFRCKGRTPCNRAAESLLVGAHVTSNLVERTGTIRRAEQMIVDDTPQIVLLTLPRWALVGPRVSGWAANALSSHPVAKLDVIPAP